MFALQAMGINLSLGRAGSSLNDYLTLKIYNIEHSIPMALWSGFLLLIICLIFTVVIIIIKKYQQRYKSYTNSFSASTSVCTTKDILNFRDIKQFNILYWLVTVSCVIVYGCILPWYSIGSDFMQHVYNFSNAKANKYLMIPYLTSACLTPFVGYACDRIGRRAELLLASVLSITMAHFIFAFVNSIQPIYALLLLGVGYSMYAAAIWPSISLVVDKNRIGTAYGLVTAVQNAGQTVIPIIVGSLTGKHLHESSRITNFNNEYVLVEIFFFTLGSCGMIIGIILLYVDRKHTLRVPSIKK